MKHNVSLRALRMLALGAAMLAGNIFCLPCFGETVKTGVLMAGTRYQTRFYIKTASLPGPTIVVIGGMHGNETAGYMAARSLVHWNVTAGTLVVLPDAHEEAIRRNVRAFPGNMNNMFPGLANGDAMHRLAFEIFGMIREQHPDLLLTLHESVEFHNRNPKRYGQTLCYDFPQLTPLMQRVLNNVNPNIAQQDEKFSVFVEPHPTCPTYQAWVQLHTPATSIETCRELPLATRIRYQLMVIEGFFDEQGLGYAEDDVSRLTGTGTPHQQPTSGDPATVSPHPKAEPPVVTPPEAAPNKVAPVAPSLNNTLPVPRSAAVKGAAPGAAPIVKVADSIESLTLPETPAVPWWRNTMLLLTGAIFAGVALGSLGYGAMIGRKRSRRRPPPRPIDRRYK